MEVDGEEENNVAKILDSKLDRRYKCCLLHYYIRWAGYKGTDDEFSWVAADELVPAFHAHYPQKPGP